MKRFSLICLLLALLAGLSAVAAPVVKDGEKIAFLGDSITWLGWVPGNNREHGITADSRAGYVKLVIEGLAAAGVKATAIPAGVGGDNSIRMLARLDKDVISKKPDWLCVSCGVNDVWGLMGSACPLDKYTENMTAIIDKAQQAGIKVVVLTPTPINEARNEQNDRLAAYVTAERELAKQKGCLLADLNARIWADRELPDVPRNAYRDHRLTVDGVHMNPRGNVSMALGILETLGVSAEQCAALRAKWLADKDMAQLAGWAHWWVYPLDFPKPVSIPEWERLSTIAYKDNGRFIGDMIGALSELTAREVLLTPRGPFETLEQACKSPDKPALEKQCGVKFNALIDDLLAAPTPEDGLARLQKMSTRLTELRPLHPDFKK